ncbi:MAG: hypothetical protein ABI459_03780 [Deltaproteobacteria bacterium]
MSNLAVLSFAAAFMVSGSPAAQAWTPDMQRGLDLYFAKTDAASLTLICDPLGVYGGDETAILVSIGGKDALTGKLTIRFDDGAAVELGLSRGRFGKRDSTSGTWAELLANLRSQTDVTLIWDGNKATTLSTGKAVTFSCT